jgi:class 3 adenylate cyclase
VEQQETQYTRSADGTALAYQVTGDGPLDLLFLPGHAIPVDLMWDDPGWVRIRRRLSAFCRTVWIEPRGFGASEGDPLDAAGEIMNEDLIAVLDAVGCSRVAVLGSSFFGSTAVSFASTHPARVTSLVLVSTYAHYLRSDDYPIGMRTELLTTFKERVTQNAATGADLETVAPSRAADPRFRAWWSRSHRLTGGPQQLAEATCASYGRDVRELLPSLGVPALVLHRRGDRSVRVEAGRFLAEHIPGAKYVELPGDDHLLFVGDTDALFDEVEEFLTGARSGGLGDSVLKVVLFTDIVKSTEEQARVGQRGWSRVTDEHDARVRNALLSHGGREIKTTGDGFLVTFDSAARALLCASEVARAAHDIGVEVRAGVHAGDIELRGDDIAGLPVNIGKRVCDLAAPGEVLVTDTVRGLLVGSNFQFSDTGEHELKGLPGRWRLFAVSDRK